MSPWTRVLFICFENECSTHTWAHGTPSPSTLPRVYLLGAITPVLFAHMHDGQFTSCSIGCLLLYCTHNCGTPYPVPRCSHPPQSRHKPRSPFRSPGWTSSRVA